MSAVRNARLAMAGKVTEAQFQQTVIRYAQLRGWRVAHFRHARQSKGRGYATPVAADGAGFPDLVFARPGSPVVFAELKARRGVVSEQQRAWLDVLGAAAGDVVVRLWRPTDWDEIEAVLGQEVRA